MWELLTAAAATLAPVVCQPPFNHIMEAEKHTPAGEEDPGAHPFTRMTYLNPRLLLYSLSLSLSLQPLYSLSHH